MSSQQNNVQKTYVWALVGNPNAGKTSLFNSLCGTRHPVGNYPGVTVERRSGEIFSADQEQKLVFIDLPGTYSLKANSPDEKITRAALTGELSQNQKPDAILPDAVLFVADSTNIHRNFFLLSQLTELNLPIVIALTMADELKSMGIEINVPKIEQKLGYPTLLINTRLQTDIQKLREILFCGTKHPSKCSFPFSQYSLAESPPGLEVGELEKKGPDPRSADKNAIKDCDPYFEKDLSEARYKWVSQLLDPALTHLKPVKITLSERLDYWLTHPRWGFLFFVLIMFSVFFSIYTIAQPLMDQIDAGFKYLADTVGGPLSGMPILQSLVTDGIIGGVGSVLAFTPQIIILFTFVSILEDSGYMARAAFLMDRLLAWSGLNGRSFIPLLSSFACAVPGIMSARVMSDPKARLSTILIAPLMSCSARLPVYLLMIGTFIQPLYGTFWAAVALFMMHSLGLFYALPIAWFLNFKMLKTDTQPFILELPRYRLPQFKTVYYRVTDTTKNFLKQAGSIILAVTILIWALSYFPHKLPQNNVSTLSNANSNSQSTLYLEKSYLGQLGKALEPVFRPLGFDWRITIGILSAFPAREVIISTFGILFERDSQAKDSDQSLKNQLRQARDSNLRPLFTPLVAVNLMVFFALCCQCSATLATIKNELGSWKWSSFVFGYMSLLAYLSSFLIYQIGSCFLN